VNAKNYLTLGYITKDAFDDICFVFPDVLTQMKKQMTKYQDRFKVYVKVLNTMNFLGITERGLLLQEFVL